MTLIEYRGDGPSVVADDWVKVSDEEALPTGYPAIVSISRWKAQRDELSGRNQPLGVRLESHERIEEILADLPKFSLIALDFPNLNDGRHFTWARLLRERFGFEGQIRATGQVLRDQVAFMRRCVFDAFELPSDKDLHATLGAFREISVVYQPGLDSRATASARRRRQWDPAPAC